GSVATTNNTSVSHQLKPFRAIFQYAFSSLFHTAIADHMDFFLLIGFRNIPKRLKPLLRST
ncbi:hypothetical protein HN51_015964, partial [Arachis hypogaea]